MERARLFIPLSSVCVRGSRLVGKVGFAFLAACADDTAVKPFSGVPEPNSPTPQPELGDGRPPAARNLASEGGERYSSQSGELLQREDAILRQLRGNTN